jgi:hypothetical protein
LDGGWEHVGDRTAFLDYVGLEVSTFLEEVRR